jgi:hypothetical protein
MNILSAWLGQKLSCLLSAPRHVHSVAAATDSNKLVACMRAGDVLLVEGNPRVSVAIKYLTQSTWSHAALYVGDAIGRRDENGELLSFVEADLVDGVRAVPASSFKDLQCRICRPLSLTEQEVERVVTFALERIGLRYDLRNVFDLARYLMPTPPVALRWRRRMLALGSGDPTRAICSTLIAQAFQSVRYPILPIIEAVPSGDPLCPGCVSEVLHVRHHSLFVPRDFDVSPYFAVLKPAQCVGFDHHALIWGGPVEAEPVRGRDSARSDQRSFGAQPSARSRSIIVRASSR